MIRRLLTEVIFRLSLWLYPSAFRRTYGDEMLYMLRQQFDDAVAAGRWSRFFGAVVLDSISGPWRARLHHRDDSHSRRHRSQVSTPTFRPARHRREASTMTTLPHDFLIACRRLSSSPGFTVVAVLTLALGIGANTAIFSIVYGVLLRPIGIEDAQNLAVLKFHRAADPSDSMGFWPGYLQQIQEQSEGQAGIRQLASYLNESVTLESGDRAEEVGNSLMVDGNFFSALGVKPVLGRVLGPEDVVPNQRGSVCVLGESYWRQRFGGDEDVIGRSLVLDGRPVTVVGVMPGGVPLPQIGVQLWMTQGWDAEDPTLYGRVAVLARLEPAPESADRAHHVRAANALAGAAARVNKDFPRLDGYTIGLGTFRDSLVGTARPAILAVAGGVGLILLIACANMASLLLARAASREQEMATRRALGAHRIQVASQLLVESVLLALLGGAAGVLLAFGLHRLLLGLASGLLPRLYDVHLDLPVLAFAALASILTGLLFGLAPVAYTFTHDLASAMRGSNSSSRRGLVQVRGLLVVAQVALAVTLTIGAALMIRSLLALLAVDPGFDSAGVGGARVYLDSDSYSDDNREALYFEQLIERLNSRPDIEIAGASSGLPMDPMTIDYDVPYQLPGDERGDDVLHQAYFRTITPGYINAIGIPLRRGRIFDDRDHKDGEQVALINETFARLAWPGREALGESFTIFGGRRQLRIVGVVGDVRFAGPADVERAEFFVPHSQLTYSAMAVVARGNDAGAVASAVAREALALDPHQPVNSTFTLFVLERDAVASPRFLTLLLVTFAGVALLLAAAGIYGVLSGWVEESRRELGVRMALGAGAPDVIGLVLRRSLTATALGLFVGIGVASLAMKALSPFLFGVGAADPGALVAVVCVLTAVALAASLAPAVRAARLQPMNVLRLE